MQGPYRIPGFRALGTSERPLPFRPGGYLILHRTIQLAPLPLKG